MLTQTMASECLAKNFITAILLTGSAKQAEAAVLDCTDSPNLLGTAAAAIRRTAVHPRETTDEGAAAELLPVELRNVLRLPSELRRYFVLRMLMAMPRESCAALLKVDTARVDEATCQAVIELARIANIDPAGDSAIPLSSHFN